MVLVNNMRSEYNNVSLSLEHSGLSADGNSPEQQAPSPVSDLETPMHLREEKANSELIDSQELQQEDLLPYSRSPDFSNSDVDANTSAKKEIEQSQPRKTQSLRNGRSISFGWWWETASVVLSIACTAAIVAVLLSIDGKPLAHWRIHKIKPNSLVSVFSQIAKSALLFPLAECLGQLKWEYFEQKERPVNQLQNFDGASRGPWGSVLFLWNLRGRAVLASLGAIVTILILAFEPFAQQVIDYPLRGHQYHNSTGTFHVSSKWFNGYDGSNLIPADQSVYIPVTAGVLTVLGNQEYDPSPSYDCPTSECRLQNIDALGICSTCEVEPIDVTSFDNCTADLSEWMTGTTENKAVENGTYKELSDYLNKLPAVDADYRMTMKCTKQHPDFPQISLTLESNSSPGLSLGVSLSRDKGVYTMSQEFVISNDPSSSSRPVNDTDKVANVTLRFCVYGDSNLGQGQPSSSLIKASCFSSSTDLASYTNIRNVGQINGTLHTCDLHLCERHYDSISILNGIRSYTGFNAYNLKPSPMDSIGYLMNATSISPPQNLYEMNIMALWDLKNQFNETANSNNANIMHDSTRPTTLANGSALDNFPLMFDRFADVLTSVIQSSGNPDGREIAMEVYDADVFVEVRWQWMIMPFCIISLALVFLGLSVWESRKKDYLLKTSILAVMYYGLDAKDWKNETDAVEESVHRRARESDLVERTKKFRAIFAYGDNGQMKLKAE